jgi:hypothetical protein
MTGARTPATRQRTEREKADEAMASEGFVTGKTIHWQRPVEESSKKILNIF